MAYIYEINGQRVEFEKEPTEADIDEAARQLGPAPQPTPGFAEEAKGVALAAAVPIANAVTGAVETAIENPLATAVGASFIPGVNKLPIIRDIKTMREGLVDRFRPGAGSATPPAGTPGSPSNPIGSSAGSAARQIPINVQPTGPVAPSTSPILDAQGRPMVRPVAPTPTAPTMPTMTAGEPPIRPPAQPSIMDRAAQIVRQIAANRVVQGVAKVGGTAAAALTPGNVGQNYPFPQSGPLRGSEINPNTGRPWTQQELDAYRAQYGG